MRLGVAFFSSAPLHVAAIHKEIFTTNAVCSAQYCVNPVFPGLEDLYLLGKQQFSCQTLEDVAPSLNFCSNIVNYNPSLPLPTSTKTVSELVFEQEQKAMTTYFMHLNAMGLEGWDYSQPQLGGDPCSESIWKMACYTYFPKTPRNCEKDAPAAYIRPCESSCQNYLKQCRVECCDESVQCTFQHAKKLDDETSIETTGYAPHDGPSMFCTGGTSRGKGDIFGILVFLLGFFFVSNVDTSMSKRGWFLCFALGCLVSFGVPASALNVKTDGHHVLSAAGNSTEKLHGVALTQMSAKSDFLDPPSHQVGNWRAKEDYLIKFQYVPPGATSSGAVINSCSLTNLAQTLQCNGRGMCKPFNPSNIANPITFCECDRDYADPECRTTRKSQVVAYLLSIFLGPLGIDRFYLGFPLQGAVKMITLGGVGVWWIIDIVYIGSAPVYAANYRLAANLPHWTFVITSVSFFVIIGFVLAGCITSRHIRNKRRAALLYQADEDAAEYAQNIKINSLKAPQPQVSFPR